jgi:3-keto-5-aminohexanoate cleavage enzyme
LYIGCKSEEILKETPVQPLVITATPNISWLHPSIPYPRSTAEIVAEAELCRKEGASILHIHAEDRWVEVLRAVRARSDIIVQCGMSSLPIPARMDVYKEKGDMISIILNHHDEAFAQTECNALHTKEELSEYARLCKKHGVVPEFEVWHSGSIWNLNWMIKKKMLKPPYVTTLFFGWPGGTWSPPTIEEYLHRRKQMPAGCICTVSIMEEHQVEIVTAAILNGDHVRVGTEDYPFDRTGRPAACHTLVAEAAAIARSLGRPVATPAQARKLIGSKR